MINPAASHHGTGDTKHTRMRTGTVACSGRRRSPPRTQAGAARPYALRSGLRETGACERRARAGAATRSVCVDAGSKRATHGAPRAQHDPCRRGARGRSGGPTDGSAGTRLNAEMVGLGRQPGISRTALVRLVAVAHLF
jgi:hypothetical protein